MRRPERSSGRPSLAPRCQRARQLGTGRAWDGTRGDGFAAVTLVSERAEAGARRSPRADKLEASTRDSTSSVCACAHGGGGAAVPGRGDRVLRPGPRPARAGESAVRVLPRGGVREPSATGGSSRCGRGRTRSWAPTRDRGARALDGEGERARGCCVDGLGRSGDRRPALASRQMGNLPLWRCPSLVTPRVPLVVTTGASTARARPGT